MPSSMSLIQILGYQSQAGSLGDTTHHLLLPGHRITDHSPLAMTIQASPFPSNNPAFKLIHVQVRDKDVSTVLHMLT